MVYELVVNFALSLVDMIKLGAYGWVNLSARDWEWYSPRTGEGEVTVSAELIHLDRDILSDDAVAEIDKLGYRPATYYELLAFGAMYPDIQREFPIIALGSSCMIDGNRIVAYLSMYSSMRSIVLLRWSKGCYHWHRFLVVRK